METRQYVAVSLMILARISTEYIAGIYFIQIAFLVEMLQLNCSFYAGTVGRFIFMEENARPHRANFVNNWFHEVIYKIYWPPNSSTLHFKICSKGCCSTIYALVTVLIVSDF